MIDLNELRAHIEENFGEKITTNKQCRSLKICILEKTNRKISETTLRRFFGLLSSSSKLSKYTIATLITYSNFNTKNKITDDQQDGLWNDIRKESLSYTNYYIQSIKNKSISDYALSINRVKVEDILNNFIESDKNYTSLIAPGGYGKSTLLAKWIENPKSSINSNDIILFTNALIFENTFQSNNKARIIDLNLNTSNILQLIKQSNQAKGRFVIIIDAVDELSLNIDRLNRFITWIIEFVTQNNTNPWFKVILSVRNVTYDKYITPLFVQNTSSFNQNNNTLCFTENKIKVPYYESKEVISILQKTINTEELNSFLDQITNPEILSLLQTPINLALYQTDIFLKNTKEKVSVIYLYQQLLNTYIYQSTFVDEKTDIIEAIIKELIDKSSFSIPKNILKKTYPIHIKQKGNYFAAYNELIKDGILYEYIQNDINNIATYVISFKHVNIYYYLCAIYMIKQHGKLNSLLFEKIINEYSNLEFKINIIGYLFSIAYKNENIEAIRNFYNLEESILDSINMAITIGLCLRDKNNIQDELILNFAKNPLAQRYFFEEFVDINQLILGFDDNLKIYNKYKKTNEANIYCNSLHLYKSLQTLNKKDADFYLKKLKGFSYDESVYPWPIGRYLGYSIIYSAFFENKKNLYSLDYLLEYRSIAYKNVHTSHQKQYFYDVTLIFALALTKQYKNTIEYAEKILVLVNKTERFDDFYYYEENFHYNVIQAILIYSRYKTNDYINPKDIELLISFAITNGNHYSSYQYIIITNLYISELLLKYEKTEKAQEYFDTALNLCNYCKYDLLKAYILYNNPFNNQKFKTIGQEMFETSGFLYYDMAIS